MYLPPLGKKLFAMFLGGVQRSPGVISLHGSGHELNWRSADVDFQSPVPTHVNMRRLVVINKDDEAHAMRAKNDVHG
jgi:hypothetical protein